MKKIAALLLIVLGSLLVLSGAGYAFYREAVDQPGSAPLPDQIAGLALVRGSAGWQATTELGRLRGKDFPLSSGAIGIYGADHQVTLWVSGTPLELMAPRMLVAMRDRIADGRSPFIPTGERQDGKRMVYELEGMGQQHFYFKSGKLLIWLAADSDLAEVALKESPEFYP